MLNVLVVLSVEIICDAENHLVVRELKFFFDSCCIRELASQTSVEKELDSFLRVFLANQVGQLGKEALKSHVLSQNAADISHEPARRIDVADCAMVALRGDNHEDPGLYSTLDSVHEPLIVDRQIAHSVA